MEWIKVTDKLPTEKGYYLVVTETKGMETIQISHYDKHGFWLKTKYWLELPKMPK